LNALPTPAATRTVTFLFTDIEGSTQLWERFPEPMQAALVRHDTVLRAAIENNHGHVIKTTGDGLHAVFESASDGIAAVVTGQRALGAERWGTTGALKVRMALHTGEAEARDGDYYGPIVNRAARLMSVAAGGQILLSAVTAELVQGHLPDGLALRDLGEHRLKDLVRPEHVFQVVAPDLPADFPPLKSLNAFPNNLPVQLSTFIGRERELAEARRLLLTTRLLSLVGPGGTGKTRLSLQLAADCLPSFADGVWFVELATLADPALVLQTIASVLGVREQAGMPLMETSLNYLRAKQLLLILDNCEHLVAACARLADQLLHASPKMKLLASSREPLGINGEAIFRVPSLSLPDPAEVTRAAVAQYESVQLFLERAIAANPKLKLTEKNAASVAQICRRLDGIPLALELAAARASVFSVEQIASRLDDRFKLLTGGSRTALPRQQTLQALIDWSYDILSEPERVLLRRLSVFTGGWTFEAAETINSDLDVLNLLSQLVNKSLVVAEEVEEGDTRYRLLETIRQYARDKLLAAGELDRTRELHLDYFVRLAETAGPQVDSPSAAEWLPRLEAEYDNLRAALEWALEHDVEAALRLVAVLFAFWFRRGRMVEGLNWIAAALARAEEQPILEGDGGRRQMRLHAQAWQAMASLANMNDNPLALKAGEAASALARQLGDSRMLAISLSLIGAVRIHLGDRSGALAPIAEGLALARQGGDKYSLGIALDAMAQYSAIVTGDFEAAARYEAEGLALLSGNEASWGGIFVFFNSARAAIERGDYPTARARYLALLPSVQMLGDEHRLNMIASELAHIQRYEGHYLEAEAAYRETIRGWQRLGHRSAVAHQLESFAFAARAQAEFERAARLLGAAASLREQINIPMGPQERVEYDRELAGLRANLDEKAFAALWTEGRAMSMEAAIDYALLSEPSGQTPAQ
jgi:predicted ATPase/class 3 adenylate cyclase